MADPVTDPVVDPAGDPTGAPDNTTPPVEQADKPLGPGGEKALAAEREARKALEKRVKELEPLTRLLSVLSPEGDSTQPSDIDRLAERLSKHETELSAERAARWRAEVAHEKGLTPAQAARLSGATRDELASDADALLALFPAQPTAPRTPSPDPSQGSRGNGAPDIATQIAAAESAGDWQTVIALKRQQANAQN